jgi:Polyketide cyclase / dehydrase and lipid transport
VAVDVLTEIVIARPRAEVAAYASDPDNAPKWYVNIKRAQRLSPTSVAFEARFLGRTLRYAYEIVEDAPGERYVMRNDSMETTYEWSDTPDGTRMTLRNRGSAPRLTAPFVRRANRKDLARLKEILETGH